MPVPAPETDNSALQQIGHCQPDLVIIVRELGHNLNEFSQRL